MVAEKGSSYSAESAARKLSSLPMAYKTAMSRVEAQHIQAHDIRAHDIQAHHLQAQQIQPHRSPSPEDLRRAFEKAMIEIHQSGFPADKNLQYRRPIVQRAKRLGISQARAEECALSDAARALALLWKI